MTSRPLGPARVRLAIAGASVAVLALGVLLQPHAREFTLPATESPAPMLKELIADRDTSQTIEAVQGAARRVRGAVVAFERPAALPAGPALRSEWPIDVPSRSRRGAGLLLSTDGDVLTVGRVVGGAGARAWLSGGREVGVDVTSYDPDTDLAIVRVATKDRLTPAEMADQPPEPGELVFAAAGDTPELVVPMFVAGRDGDDYVLSGPVAVAGAPLFTVGGRAFAVAAGGSDRAHALGVAIERLRRLASEGRGNPSGIGATFQDAGGDLAGPDAGPGALVADVVPGSPADAGGLRAGDVVIAVAGSDADGADRAAQLIAALPPALPATFTVHRGRRTLDPAVTPVRLIDGWWRGASRAAPGGSPLAAEWLGAQFTAPHVSRTTRLIAVDGRAPALIRPKAGMLLQVEDGGRRFFTRVR